MSIEYYHELFAPQIAKRPWIITADAAAGAFRNAQRLLDAGAPGVMIVGGTAGTGTALPDGAELFLFNTTGPTMMSGLRAFQEALSTPPRELCDAIDAWDPDGRAAVLGNFLNRESSLCGRAVLGASRPEWQALEDKMIVDQLWDRAGVARTPVEIVDARDSESMARVARRIAESDGAVVVADNTEGWHGGAEYTRYLAPDADWSEPLSFLAAHATRARVMAFLRGVPCSIHGLVLPDRVLVFRPVELLIYRRPSSDEFVYCGMDTIWDPPPGVRDQMRAAARAVGTVIRDEVAYRGFFGIDGVCTRDGFFPTELNPRLTAAVSLFGAYPYGDINRAVIEGMSVDLRLDEMEDEIVAHADLNRSGRWLRPITHLSADESTPYPIRWTGAAWESCEEGDATATMHFGPSAQGALVFTLLEEKHGLASGESIAEIAAQSFQLADEVLDTRIGELIPGTSDF
ncbi:MAG: hypothetical protein HKN07_12565 [Acidimicrobiia bacterium]|nr:hypothetical protein [Acidimicrobiia bacterium]